MGIVAGGIDEQCARCLLRYLLTLCALPAGREMTAVEVGAAVHGNSVCWQLHGWQLVAIKQ